LWISVDFLGGGRFQLLRLLHFQMSYMNTKLKFQVIWTGGL